MGVRIILPSVLAAFAALGQTGEPLRFEAASIKPSPPPEQGRLMVRMRDLPGRLNYSSVSLKAMLQRACGVWNFQISGPDWMGSVRFDVVATYPAGTSASRVPEMLRSLLAERFRMTVHRETREQPVYALVVAKNGPRMKEAAADSDASPGDKVPAQGGNPNALDCGATGKTTPAAGWMLNKGPGRFEGHGMNMASLASTLATRLGRAVVDQTGLEGTYDFELNFTPDEGAREPGPGVSASDPNGESIFSAIQSQLGLKLEARRGPVEMVVVDRAERVPTAN